MEVEHVHETQKMSVCAEPMEDDLIEDDSSLKMKLAITTSDEDSNASGKNATLKAHNAAINQKKPSNPSLQKFPDKKKLHSPSTKLKVATSKSPVASALATNSKRKHIDATFSSDEEDFAGFDEVNGEPVAFPNPWKKVKEERISEEEGESSKNDITEISTKQSPIKTETLDVHDSKLPDELMAPKAPETKEQSGAVQQTSSTPAKHKTTDEIYRKPFETGWKRELVYRAIPGVSKDKGEVYYITPDGKKLRTRNDILQNLTVGLTLENFTFAKEPIGVGPDEELIRSAKPSARVIPADTNLGKRIPKPKAPKGASPPPQGWTSVRAVKPSPSASSPRPAVAANVRNLDDAISDVARTPTSNKSSTKTPKVQKKNTIVNSSSPSLTTGDDAPTRKRLTNSRTQRNENVAENQQSPRSLASLSSSSSSESFATNFFGNVSIGYHILLQTFQYLKVQELLRAACVCRVWNVVANHRSLWKTIRMKNSQVNDWTGLAAALRRNGTKHLDLRKMLISSTNGEEMWTSFSKNIGIVTSLQTIDLCRCSSKIVERLFLSNSQLKILNAVTIKDETINLINLEQMNHLHELRLKSLDYFILENDLLPLKDLKNLVHLSLTSFRALGSKEIQVIGDLTALESLELGECADLSTPFAVDVLPKLLNLERLRLEKGQENCCTLDILEEVSKLEKLVQLELVNFDIKTGFEEKMAKCKNIKRFLVIPTYISQSATTNNIVLKAVLQLSESLQLLTWAVTLELLRVTALYVDQCDNKKKDKKFFDESIPVLKPVPGISDNSEKAQQIESDVPQVEILPLARVEKILTIGMPTTKLKILKVPYHATWRQNLVDI